MKTIKEALKTLEQEVAIMEVRDSGYEGARILKEVLAALRVGLPPKIAWLLLATWLVAALALTSCATQKETAPATRSALVAATPVPFDCRAYAKTLIPWVGPPNPRVGRAASEAQLPPDDPQFDERRKAACKILQADAASK